MMKLKKEEIKVKKNKNSKGLLLLGLFLLLIGITLYTYNLYKYEEPLIENEKSVDVFFKQNNKSNTKIKYANNQSEKVYIAVLEIPSISLKTGLVDFKSSRNDVDKGIQIIEGSQFPDVDKENLILAAHSGTSNISYFKNLYKLRKGAKVYIYYSGIKYEYILDNIYNVKKTGKVKIQRNSNKNTLTLITCTQNNDTEQTVYISYLNAKEKY